MRGRAVLMAMLPELWGTMTLSDEQRRALEILADAGARGGTLDMLIENGFPAELLADLVSDGLAMMQGETVEVGGRAIEVVRVLITDIGQSAIEDQGPGARWAALRPQKRSPMLGEAHSAAISGDPRGTAARGQPYRSYGVSQSKAGVRVLTLEQAPW
jgi:hypothetical protein